MNAINATHDHAHPWSNWLSMELLVVAIIIVVFAFLRSRLSVEHPGKFTVYAQRRARDDWEQYFSNPRVQELIRSTYRLIKAPPFDQ